MRSILISFLLSTALAGTSQTNFLEELAEKTCECAEEAIEEESETKSEDIGKCIILNAFDYEKEFLNEYGIDLSEINGPGGREIGELVAAKMLKTCPELILALGKKESAKKTKDFLNASGRVKKILTEDFITLEVMTTGKSTIRVMWLLPVETDFDVVGDYTNLKGENISFTYYNQALYDPKIGDYRNFKILKSLSIE